MELVIFGTLMFLGLFLLAFGISQKRPLFIVAGAVIAMATGTALVSGGIDIVTGSTTMDFGNGTLVIQDIKTNHNDWMTQSAGRLVFWLGFLGMVLELTDSFYNNRKE